MPWIKIDDHFDEHLKHVQIGPPGWGYWLAGLAYCARNLTDGFIPYAVAYSLAGWQVWDGGEDDPEGQGRERIWTYGVASGMGGEDLSGDWIVTRVVTAGLWEEVPGGFRVHDYLDYNPSRAEVLAERERVRGRVTKHRDDKRKDTRKDTGNAGGNAGGNAVSNAGGNAVSNAGVTGAPVPVPVPVQRASKEALSSAREDSDPLDTYNLLTSRVPSKDVMDWLDRLVDEYGEDAISKTMATTWKADPSIRTFLGTVETTLAKRAKAEAKSAAVKAETAELEYQRSLMVEMPPEQRQANLQRVGDMLRDKGLLA